MKKLHNGSSSRARWAAIGAAIAVTLGVGGVAVTNAVVSTGEKAAFIPISPCRLFDLRPAPLQVGPRSAPLGPGETFTQAVHGTNGNCTIPADATAVAMNVTAVDGTAGSFLTIWPSDVSPRPLASNLNWVPGSPPTPNKVDVKLSATGSINLFNPAGTVAVLADVVGYYADHNHDDRYYSKAEIDAKLNAEIVMASDAMFTSNNGLPPTSVVYFTRSTRVIGGNGVVEVSLGGPKNISGVAFGLKSVTYCFDQVSGGAFVTTAQVLGEQPTTSASDPTDRTVAGCYTLAVNHASSSSYFFSLFLSGGAGQLDINSVSTTWAPAALLPASAPESPQVGPESGLIGS